MLEDNYICDDDNIIDENNHSYSKSSKSKKRSLKKSKNLLTSEFQRSKKKKGAKSSSSSKFSEVIPELFSLPLNSETKYRNSILNANMYNEYFKNERSQISKHFLKRKLKSAFEREPLDKCKGFFNVQFIPTVNMFSVSTNLNNQQINPQVASNNVSLGNYTSSNQNGKIKIKIDKKVNCQNIIVPNQKNPNIINSNNNLPKVLPIGSGINGEIKVLKQETQNYQKKSEIFSTTYRERAPNIDNSLQGANFIPNSNHSITNIDEKKIEKEIKNDLNSKNNTNQHQNSLLSSTNVLINKLNGNSHNQELKNLLKESNLSIDQIENLKKSALLGQNIGNNLVRNQQNPQVSYMKQNYSLSNNQNEIDMNLSNHFTLGQQQNYYIDKSNKVLNNNSNNVNDIMKALKQTGNLQILQNIAAKVNSGNISNNFNNKINFQNDLNMNNNLEQEINFSSQNSHNQSLIQNYRNQQFNANSLYNQQINPMIKNGINLNNNFKNTQTNLKDEDIMNSFNLNNNYD